MAHAPLWKESCAISGFRIDPSVHRTNVRHPLPSVQAHFPVLRQSAWPPVSGDSQTAEDRLQHYTWREQADVDDLAGSGGVRDGCPGFSDFSTSIEFPIDRTTAPILNPTGPKFSPVREHGPPMSVFTHTQMGNSPD